MTEEELVNRKMRSKFRSEIEAVETFKTQGVGVQDAKDYLDTREGKIYVRRLIESDASVPLSEIRNRAVAQLASGRELPRMEVINEPLVKLTAAGADVSPYSPFFCETGSNRRGVRQWQEPP